MNIWKVILSTLVIFTAGIFTGALVNGLNPRALDRSPRFPFRESAAKKAGANFTATTPTNREPAKLQLPGLAKQPTRIQNKEFLERLNREVKLTPEQHQELEKILEASQLRSKEIWERIAPDLREEMKVSREKMKAVFTPAQARQFDELLKPKPVKPVGPAQPATAPPAPVSAPANP